LAAKPKGILAPTSNPSEGGGWAFLLLFVILMLVTARVWILARRNGSTRDYNKVAVHDGDDDGDWDDEESPGARAGDHDPLAVNDGGGVQKNSAKRVSYKKVGDTFEQSEKMVRLKSLGKP
jgi:hypothetical protein